MSKDLDVIFERLKAALKAYETGLTVKFDQESRYELYSTKDIIIEGRKKKEIFFAGLILQKSYVGFYYMPVYVSEDLKKVFKPELLRQLKGKSCFHIKALDEGLEEQIKEALAAGFELYKERGWL